MEPASALELLADVGVGLDALARRRGDLRQHHLALVLRILLEEAAEGLELLRQALGVVEPVDADDAADRRCAPARGRASRLALAKSATSMPMGKLATDTQPVEQPDAAVRHDAAADAVGHVVDEVGDVGLGLQADQIVGGERARELLVLGDGHEGLPGRKRNVQVEADRVGDARAS